jgi:hypothetical protein
VDLAPLGDHFGSPLEAQHFFTVGSIKDMLRKCISRGLSIERFHEMYCIQLNETHPAIAVAELMRELIDKHGLLASFPYPLERFAIQQSANSKCYAGVRLGHPRGLNCSEASGWHNSIDA